MTTEKENIKELLEKFLSPQEAAEAEHDIQEGEKIFHDNPAPQPQEKLLYLTKAEIAARLNYHRANSLRRIVIKAAAVAALFAIISYLSVFFQKDNLRDDLKVSQIQQSTFFADDHDITMISNEIEQISSNLASLGLEQNGSTYNDNILEIEMKLVELDSSFWKG